MTASLFVLAIAMCEFPNTITASRHLESVNFMDTKSLHLKNTLNNGNSLE